MPACRVPMRSVTCSATSEGAEWRLTTDAQGRHSALYEQDQHCSTRRVCQSGPDFAAIRSGAEFGVLRRRFRRFVFPMSALFMVGT